jgi:hypothetical protein
VHAVIGLIYERTINTMSELYDRIISQKSGLEELVMKIPGFRGYQEKQARRTADRILRDYIAGEIERRIERLIKLEKKILDKVGMGHISKTRDAKQQMQIFHDKVKTAAPKYDGMWAQMKIGTEELERIYSFDEAMIRYVSQMDEALDAIEGAIAEPDGLESAVEKLYDVAGEAGQAFDLRDDMLTGLSKTV